MITIKFDFQQIESEIMANPAEKFEIIARKFVNDNQIQLNDIFFLSNGRVIEMDDIINNIIGTLDRQNNEMKILVIPLKTIININNYVNQINNNNDINNNITNNINIGDIHYHEVICPFCKESCKFEMKNYRITLSGCKNGHKLENIKLNEYLDHQKIDYSKIFCGNCKTKNRGEIPNKEFYKCLKCNMNLCPLCSNNHENSHEIINYDLKNFICSRHKKLFFKNCSNCNKDICPTCENEHKNHNTYYISKDLNQIRTNLNMLRNEINKMNYNIKAIIAKLNKVMNNMELFYNIHDYVLSFFENNNIFDSNQETNLNNFNSNIINELDKIKYKYNYGKNIYKLLYVYNDMEEKNLSIDMNYIPVNNNNKQVRIFGKTFVNNNKDNCLIIYREHEFELTQFFEDINPPYKNKAPFTFKLKGINNIINMEDMFSHCDTLISLPDISNIDTSNVININGLFSQCHLVLSLPDISKWDTSNVIDMGSLFSGCFSLKSLPDLSRWDTSNVRNMSFMFNSCSSLQFLPDISNWNTFNVKSMKYMFNQCQSLKSLPDINKWDNKNADFKGMFSFCNWNLEIPYRFKYN